MSGDDRHNHLTRDIKPQGVCPACDRHYSPAGGRSLEELQERVSYDATERRGRYYAAMVSGPSSLESVLRLVDAEVEEARNHRCSSDGYGRCKTCGAEEPPPWPTSDTRKAVERALDLCDVWESVEPDGIMSRQRAAAILREVLGP